MQRKAIKLEQHYFVPITHRTMQSYATEEQNEKASTRPDELNFALTEAA